MKLTVLGTGNAAVTQCYNTCFVLSEGNRHFLVDAGGGNTIISRLKDAGIDWKDIQDIFVTHKHIDHILGVVWLLRLYCQGLKRRNYFGDVRIYGHEEVIAVLRQMTEMLLGEKLAAYLDTNVHLITVESGESRDIAGRKVTFFDICSTKARQFGFCIEGEGNRKLSCCGDEPYNDINECYVKDSSWLLHEAFCLASQADIFKPYEKHHSTVKDACAAAEKLGVENLVLYHTEDKNINDRRKLYTEEGSRYFSGRLYVPDDMDIIDVDI